MPEHSRLLVFGRGDEPTTQVLEELGDQNEVVRVENLTDALEKLRQEKFDGVLLLGNAVSRESSLIESGGILELVPDGIVLLDPHLRILWSNERLLELTGRTESAVGCSFYDAFGTPEILGPDFCPFHTALGSGEPARSSLRVGDQSYFEVHTRPVFDEDGDSPLFLVVVVRDVSERGRSASSGERAMMR